MAEGAETSAKDNYCEEGKVMDTPQRSGNTQIATSVSKFEESPVFNFLNSLSPIQPVKSVCISQTINPLSFTSIPSVFTSPHVNSRKGSTFLPRHPISDQSKPEFSSDEGGTVNRGKVDADAVKKIDEHASMIPGSGVTDEPSYNCSKFLVEFTEDQVDACNSSAPVSSNTKGANGESKEVKPGEWKKTFISDAVDMDTHEKSLEPGMNFYERTEQDGCIAHSLCAVGSAEQGGEGNELEHLPREVSEVTESAESCDIIAGPHGDKIDYEHLSGFHHIIRRHCLVFEKAATCRKHLNETMGAESSLLLQSDCNTSSDDQKTVSTRNDNDSSRSVAATPKDYKIFTHDSSASRRLLIKPSSSFHVHLRPSTTGQKLVDCSLSVALSNRESDCEENPLKEVAGQACCSPINDSPKKKRQRPEQAAEGEACKRCNCKKSKCLKLYCECFAAGVYCVEPCACIDCFNKPVHEDTVLATREQIVSRNPLAFAPKVIKGSDCLSEAGDDPSKTPASARHKRGCNCRKSGCLKKYCECYQGGVGCSINCRCEGCKNAFGRKDGIETGEDVIDEIEKLTSDRAVMDSVPPATPSCTGRQLIGLPFSSKRKPPKSSFLSIGSISGSEYASQGSGKARLSQPARKLEKHVGEEMPEFLEGVKLSSPNQKRVSPPHSSRKLILSSIPSFPSLTPNQ